MGKLSRKDAKVLSLLATTPELEDKLNEYIDAEKAANKLWKEFREAVVDGEGVKPVEPTEVKRKFKVGDKVRVTSISGDVATTRCITGDITEVVSYKHNDPERWVGSLERPVITERGYFEESALELVEEKSPNELRAEVIEKAKEFLSKNLGEQDCCVYRTFIGKMLLKAEFAVASEERTVKLTLKIKSTGKVWGRENAVCHPDDVFNEHLGKAIALGRALNKDVSEFENAVQPNEIVVGHSIFSTRKDGSSYEYPSVTKVEEGKVWSGFSFTLIEGLATRPKITDDTHAIYKEESE